MCAKGMQDSFPFVNPWINLEYKERYIGEGGAPTVCKLTVGQLSVVAPPVCVYSADRT